MRSTTTRPATLQRGFSFYVPARPDLITTCAAIADAVVIRGPKGPAEVRRLRSTGWTGTVLFDGCAYQHPDRPTDPDDWYAKQRDAGADRLLTPGRWVPWDLDPAVMRTAVQAENDVASRADDVTVLLAIDGRWLTARGLNAALAALSDLDRPIALVLASRTDPLGGAGAVNGLTTLTWKIDDLTILRCDHGAIGAVAFGAVHGSIGLTPSYRHFVPPAATASAIPHDRTPRVFVWELMDWFSVGTIAGWATSRITLTCSFDCCGGAHIARFFDPRRQAEADYHNRTVLAYLANYVLDAPTDQRRTIFGRLCDKAEQRYGNMGGFTTVIKPKAQLQQWAQFGSV
jgi:hypothetical protein